MYHCQLEKFIINNGKDTWKTNILTDTGLSCFVFLKQNAVIAELSEYTHNNPADAENVNKAIEYLDACRQLFERGILSHEKVTTDQTIVLENMSEGYAFFVGWADYAWEKGKILSVAFHWLLTRLYTSLWPETKFWLFPDLEKMAVDMCFSKCSMHS